LGWEQPLNRSQKQESTWEDADLEVCTCSSSSSSGRAAWKLPGLKGGEEQEEEEQRRRPGHAPSFFSSSPPPPVSSAWPPPSLSSCGVCGKGQSVYARAFFAARGRESRGEGDSSKRWRVEGRQSVLCSCRRAESARQREKRRFSHQYTTKRHESKPKRLRATSRLRPN
jgi:hypothetical protein